MGLHNNQSPTLRHSNATGVPDGRSTKVPF
jgi:hypothetical protein